MDTGERSRRDVARASTSDSSSSGFASDWTWRKWHWLVLIAAVVLRIAYALTMHGEQIFGGWDGKEYHAYAQSLLAGRADDYPRYFNCIRAPGYPLFLIPFVAASVDTLRHIQIAQALLGGLQAWLLGLIAARWAGQRAGDWALPLAAFNPFLIYYCGFVLTECVFITLLWAGMALLQPLVNPAGSVGNRVLNQPRAPCAPEPRSRGCQAAPNPNQIQSQLHSRDYKWIVGGGLAIGFACLVRPALQPFLVIAVFWIGWLALKRHGWQAAFTRMVVFTAVTSALMLPWMLRNHAVRGEFTLAPGGAALVHAQSNSMDYLRSYEARTKDEYYAALNRMHSRVALEGGETPAQWAAAAREFREKHRDEWWRLQRHKFVHFWTPWVNPLIFPRAQFVASLVAMTPLFILAAIEIVRRLRRRPDAFLALLLGLVGAGWLVGGILFHVQVRYRIPFVDVSFLVLSACWLGGVDWSRWLKPSARKESLG